MVFFVIALVVIYIFLNELSFESDSSYRRKKEQRQNDSRTR